MPLQPLDLQPREQTTAPNKQLGLKPLTFKEPKQTSPLDNILPKREASVSDTLEAGFRQGLNENFTSSLGTILESYIPLGRFFVEDDEGLHVWKPMHEVMGMTEREWDDMTPAQRRITISKKTEEYIDKQYANIDKTSSAYNIARFTGILTDPTTLVPFNPVTLGGKVATYAGLGAADAAVYSAAQEGTIDPKLVSVAASASAALPIAGRFIVGKSVKKKAASTLLDEFKTQVAIERQTSDNLVQAYQKAKENTGIPFAKLEDAMTTLDTNFKSAFKDLVVRSKAAKVLEKGDVYTSDTRRAFGSVGATFDRLFEPVSARIKKRSPKLWARMQEFERGTLQKAHEYALMVDPFVNGSLRTLRKKNPEDYRVLSKAMFNSDESVINNLISKHGLVKEYTMYREAMDDLFNLQRKVGRDLPYIKNYTPRWVKDWPKMQTVLGQEDKAIIDKILSKERTKLGRELTDDQISNIYNNYLRGNYNSKTLKLEPKSAKQRKIKEINDAMLDALSSPEQAIHSYIRDTVDDVFKRRLFGKSIVQKHGDELRGSIGDFVNDLVKNNELKSKDIDELKLLLEMRFVGGRKKPIDLIQNFKNYGYASLLGNPISAITQFGDLSFSVYKNGIVDTAKAVVNLTGKSLSPKDMGLLDNIAAEFAAETPSKKLLDKVLSASAFRAVDSLGKRAILNSTISKTTKLSRTRQGVQKLKDKWGPYLGGEEFASTVKDFQAFARGDITKPTARMKSIAFMELADIQPVSLLEMPEVYLKHPNLRIFYMLKTFTIKHINIMRQEIIQEIKRGNIRQGLTNAAALFTLFTAAGIGTETAKNLVSNKDVNMEEIVFNNLVKNTGFWDRYSLSKLERSSDPATDFVSDFMLPPLGILSPALRSVYKAGKGVSEGDLDVEDWKLESNVKYVPLVGRLIDSWLINKEE